MNEAGRKLAVAAVQIGSFTASVFVFLVYCCFVMWVISFHSDPTHQTFYDFIGIFLGLPILMLVLVLWWRDL